MKYPESTLEIFLLPGEFFFGDRHTRIRTILGSCVSITMWHPKRRIGGMCHYMLARSPARRKDATLDGKYAEDALKLFLEAAAQHGVDPKDFQCKVFGAGSMFSQAAGSLHCKGAFCGAVAGACSYVPCANARAGLAMLARHGLKVVAEDLGGNGHRNVIFDVKTGEVLVRQSPIVKR